METADKSRLKLDLLPKATYNALAYISSQSWLQDSSWYLAGGTALALQCGHRKSFDLDFFIPEKDFDLEMLIRRFIDTDWTTSLREKGTVYGELLGAKISFIAYPFFIPKQPFHQYGSVAILDEKDIAVMKLIAVSQRSRKRDFFDFYWYIKNREPLLAIFKRLDDQYPNLNHNYHHILKSFVYFTEAEEDPDPEIFFDATWEQVKKFFLDEIPKVTKDILELS